MRSTRRRTFRTVLYFTDTVTPGSGCCSCEPGRCLSHWEGAYYEISIITIKITRAEQRWTTNRRSNNPLRRRQSGLANSRPFCAMLHARRQLQITAKVDNFREVRANPFTMCTALPCSIQFRNLYAKELWWSLANKRNRSLWIARIN